MKILAIDTSSEACSVALFIDGEIQEIYKLAPREHTQIILPMIDSLLAEANIKLTQCHAIAFGRGPGSFTGIRIAASVSQALAVAADIPVIPLSSLLSLAQGAYREFNAENVLACIDARQDEVYWATCNLAENNVMQLSNPEKISRPSEIDLPKKSRWYGVGDAWKIYPEELSKNLNKLVYQINGDYHAHAYDIASLAAADFQAGKICAPEDALPIYLRENQYRKL